ncbi:MAG: hypothetical protein Q9227_006976 [Pyrenula ochraceoflavens]
MLNPTVVNIVSFFYPIGNTPAVDLTRDLPREQDARVLALGCGDVRNILFTTYCASGEHPCTIQGILLTQLSVDATKLDFTCCDIDSVVIARNVLLLSLLLDDEHESQTKNAWDIYYHIYLESSAKKALEEQARKLYDVSDSLQGWHNSPYGKTLRICDSGTLLRARAVWQTYLPSAHPAFAPLGKRGSASYLQQAKDYRQAKVPGTGLVLTGVRSAAPAMLPAVDDLPGLYRSYWKLGTTDEKAQKTSKAKILNPAFAPGLADNSILHYGIDPLLGFHLSTAYTPITNDTSRLQPSFGESGHKVVRAAQHQFQEWGRAFRVASTKGLVVRLYLGEALAFCHALHLKQVEATFPTNLYRKPNSFDVIKIDSPDYNTPAIAPLSFNVIDTSNLIDNLGTINVLVAAAPLLEDSISATIYAEIVVKWEMSLKALADSLLCGDFQTISALLGLYPSEYWANTVATPAPGEIILNKILGERGKGNDAKQMHCRFSWKRSIPASHENLKASTLPIVKYDADGLAHLLSRLYKSMFKHEDVLSMFANISLQNIQNTSIARYHRGSFAMLLRFLKERVLVQDWNSLMNKLFGHVQSPTNDLHMQEFWSQLHLLGVYSLPKLQDVPQLGPPHTRVGLETWNGIPEIVCVTLVVPREKLKVFTKDNPVELGTPPLHCLLQSGASGLFLGGWQNLYEMIQITFGHLTTSGAIYSNSFEVHVSEDQKGWAGSSPLIASFSAPRWTVLMEPQNATVALGIQNRAVYTYKFFKSLGPALNVFETRLGNTQNVFVTKNFPNQTAHPFSWKFQGFEESATHNDIPVRTSMKPSLEAETGLMRTFIGRGDFVTSEAKAALQDRSTSVEISQISPFIISVKTGNNGMKFELRYPVPVLGSKSNTFIARQSSYIEVKVPAADLLADGGLKDAMFPVFPTNSAPVRWNMPRLNIDKLHVLDLKTPSKLDWLVTHCSLMFSARESQLRNSTAGQTTDPRVNLKGTLFNLFMKFTNLQGGHQRLFGLSDPAGDGVHTLIFPSCLRLDTGNRTVVVDAAVIVLTPHIVNQLRSLLSTISLIGLCQIITLDDEIRLWKQILPSHVERCRTWSHGPACEYKTANPPRIPLSTVPGENPLCTCGNGIFPADYLASSNLPTKEWHKASRFAVRAAISPVFFSPFVEEPNIGNITPLATKEGNVDGCLTCGKEKAEGGEALKKCSRCGKAKYCSAKCQRGDWKVHKRTCGK